MKKSISKNQTGNTVLHILLAVFVVVIIGLVGWRIADRRHTKALVTTTSGTATSTTTTPSLTLSPGTDNNSLSDDLTNINGSLNQSSQDASGASNAINDQQNEIAVPTN
jgi:hypothetical protein